MRIYPGLNVIKLFITLTPGLNRMTGKSERNLMKFHLLLLFKNYNGLSVRKKNQMKKRNWTKQTKNVDGLKT